MAPERITGDLDTSNETSTTKADMWSVGVIIHLLVFGKAPFEGNQNSQLVKAIKRANINFDDKKLGP